MKESYYQKVAFMGMLLVILFTYQKYTGKKKEDFSDVKFISKNAVSIHLSEFDPNDLDRKQWRRLGFSESQISNIFNYKRIVGGRFTSREQLKKCYSISSEKFRELETYILLPERDKKVNFTSFKSSGKNTIAALKKFNPNYLSFNDWIKMGFSEKQANAILKYKSYLGGSFKSAEDLQKCFVISSEKFKELKTYIKINPSTIAPNNVLQRTEIRQEKTDFSKADLNTVTFKQLLEFGLDGRSAGSIIGFRKKLGGFVTKQQILETYNINKDIVQKLISTAQLNTSNVLKYTLINAPEEWLKSHPYFKYSADKIIFYRLSEPDEKKIWKLLKIKPEYEVRMKLYLK